MAHPSSGAAVALLRRRHRRAAAGRRCVYPSGEERRSKSTASSRSSGTVPTLRSRASFRVHLCYASEASDGSGRRHTAAGRQIPAGAGDSPARRARAGVAETPSPDSSSSGRQSYRRNRVQSSSRSGTSRSWTRVDWGRNCRLTSDRTVDGLLFRGCALGRWAYNDCGLASNPAPCRYPPGRALFRQPDRGPRMALVAARQSESFADRPAAVRHRRGHAQPRGRNPAQAARSTRAA